MTPPPLDGNVAAGDLADIFAFETTTAISTCATCHDTHPIATLRAHTCAPGIVLRCASCDAVQLRLVRAPRHTWLDVHGIDMFMVPTPAGAATIDAADAPPDGGAT